MKRQFAQIDVFTDTAYADAVRHAADAANTDRLPLRISGAYAIAARNAAMIRGDSIESTIFSVVALGLLFVLLYRRPVRTFGLAFTPVALGIAWKRISSEAGKAHHPRIFGRSVICFPSAGDAGVESQLIGAS